MKCKIYIQVFFNSLQMPMPAITVCNLNRVSCPNLKTLLDKCNENISFCDNETNILNNASLIHDRFCRGGPPSGVKPPKPDKGKKVYKNEQNTLENLNKGKS